MPVADAIRQMGITEQTCYRWKKQYAGLQSDQIKELKQLQDENNRLKKLAVDYVGQSYRVSERRAYRILDHCRATQRYVSTQNPMIALAALRSFVRQWATPMPDIVYGPGQIEGTTRTFGATFAVQEVASSRRVSQKIAKTLSLINKKRELALEIALRRFSNSLSRLEKALSASARVS